MLVSCLTFSQSNVRIMTFCFYSSHAITSDVSLSETIKAAKFFLADGIILTGAATGDPASVSEFTGIFLILTYSIEKL